MKFRTSFVTNSSSSSFVSISISNPLFARLVEKYQDYLSDEYGCVSVNVYDDEVDIQIEEGYADVPSNLDNLFNAIVGVFDEDYWYEEDEDEEDEGAFPDDEDIPEDLEGFKIEVKKNIEKLKEETTSVEFSCTDMGWQGDSDSRYYKDNYDEETLQDMLETIATEKGCKVEDLTEEDFGNYVGDKTSYDETTFSYDKETGEEKIYHNFYVE